MKLTKDEKMMVLLYGDGTRSGLISSLKEMRQHLQRDVLERHSRPVPELHDALGGRERHERNDAPVAEALIRSVDRGEDLPVREAVEIGHHYVVRDPLIEPAALQDGGKVRGGKALRDEQPAVRADPQLDRLRGASSVRAFRRP